jgi:glycosyltransferase involved in cell wall biosynthesis
MATRLDTMADMMTEPSASDRARDPGAPAQGRVAVDIGPIDAYPSGVSTYVSELVNALEILEPGRIVRIGEPSGRNPRLRGLRHLAWLQISADRDAGRAGCSLAHYTNGVAPLRTRTPFILTVHDLSLLRRPRDHPPGRLILTPVMVSAARRAQLVVVPSHATRLELQRLVHLSSERIVVVPLAARTSLVVPADGQSAQLLEALGVEPGRFVLSLGTIEPRKNHRRLLAAFERLSGADPGLGLVVVGRWGWGFGGFRRAHEASLVRDRVVLAGPLSDTDVAGLLRACAVMAYPSLYEGFGLPVLEAMAAGAPVVTSATSSLPEAAGGGAVLVDPTDAGSIAAGLADAMARRDELIAAGLARAGSRTWLDVGRETLDVYRRAAARR